MSFLCQKFLRTELSENPVSKPSAKAKTRNKVKEAEQSHGLDEQIYQMSKKTARGVRRFRVAIGAVVAVVIAVGATIWALGEFQKHSELELASQFQALLKADPSGTPPDAEALLPELGSLVESARGRSTEPWILKESVTFLLDSARARIYPKAEGANDPFSINTTSTLSLPSEPPTTPPSKPADAILDKAAKIIADAKKRFTGDTDFDTWSENSLQTIKSLRKSPKPAHNRAQKPILPPKTSAPPTAPSAAAEPEPEKK